MKPLVYLCAVTLLILAMAPGALAGTLDDAKFALHVQTKALKSLCTINDPNTQGIPCSQYTTAWPLATTADVYLVVGNIDETVGMSGLRCGIDYDPVTTSGADVFDWTLCSDGLEFPAIGPNGDWPAAGSATTITWITCQQTVIGSEGAHGVAGAFYVYAYSADTFSITPHNLLVSGSELSVADCSSFVTELPLNSVTGEVDFGGGSGVTPCQPPQPPGVLFDFDPGSCPNSLVDSNGGFAIGAIVGQAEIPVNTINQATIQVEGVTPQKVMVKDVATPFAGTPCDCHAAGGDGVDDLQLRVSRPALIAAVGPVQPGDVVVLTVTGQFNDGTPFAASDCAVISIRGGGIRELR